MEVKLFDKVKCKGYYKKAHDGLSIFLDLESGKIRYVTGTSR